MEKQRKHAFMFLGLAISSALALVFPNEAYGHWASLIVNAAWLFED